MFRNVTANIGLHVLNVFPGYQYSRTHLTSTIVLDHFFRWKRLHIARTKRRTRRKKLNHVKLIMRFKSLKMVVITRFKSLKMVVITRFKLQKYCWLLANVLNFLGMELQKYCWLLANVLNFLGMELQKYCWLLANVLDFLGMEPNY